MFRAMRIVIYTAITDGFDSIKPPLFTAQNCDYVCFTDNPQAKAEGWQIRTLPQPFTPEGPDGKKLDGNRLAKHPKVMPHLYLPDYNYSIWIDGSFQIIDDFPKIAERVLVKDNLAAFVHPEKRSSVFDEAKECMRLCKGCADQIQPQVDRYKAEGFNRAAGIPACGILIRNHMAPEVIRAMELWWEEIQNGSERDQISFDYACWKAKTPYRMLPRRLRKSLLKHAAHGEDTRKKEKLCKLIKRKLRMAWYKRTI